MDYKINLEDKSVIITGAASGIGLECVKGFLQNGSDVYMVDFNGKENEDKAAELRKAFPQNKIFTVTADLTKEEDTEKIISAVKENTGRVDVLINNAGTGANVRSLDETSEGWDRVVSLNLTSHFFVTQKIVKEFMKKQGSGKIVNMCSLSAFIGVPNAVAYSSSKGAILQMTKSLAGEWARFNVQVNCVCPGFVETPLIKENMENEHWMGYMNMRIPMKRLAKAEDIVGSVLFMSSGLADYITGASIIVDGGYSCSG